jgi:hypothetical protein
MCVRRFRLLANIDDAPIDELLSFIKRLARIYFIIGVVNIVTAATSADSKGHAQLIISIVSIVLYFVNIGAMFTLAGSPSILNASVVILTNVCIFSFNVFSLIYNVVILKSYWAFVSLIGLLVQTTTIYILVKLRGKIIAKENLPLVNGPNNMA